jgi:hypothetical protein
MMNAKTKDPIVGISSVTFGTAKITNPRPEDAELNPQGYFRLTLKFGFDEKRQQDNLGALIEHLTKLHKEGGEAVLVVNTKKVLWPANGKVFESGFTFVRAPQQQGMAPKRTTAVAKAASDPQAAIARIKAASMKG